MDEQCAGSRHELRTEPPPNTAATCPECGRAVSVEAQHSPQGMTFTIAPHGTVDGSP